MSEFPAPPSQSVELGELLATTVESVVQAQERLDAYTERRQAAFESAEDGALHLPPLWYVFEKVGIELELSARVDRSPTTGPTLSAKMLDPAGVSLYGRSAQASLRVKVEIAPKGVVSIKNTRPADPEER